MQTETAKIIIMPDGSRWIKLKCERCGEPIIMKLQRFHSSKCYGKHLEDNKPKDHGRKKKVRSKNTDDLIKTILTDD